MRLAEDSSEGFAAALVSPGASTPLVGTGQRTGKCARQPAF